MKTTNGHTDVEGPVESPPIHPMTEYEKFLFDLKGFFIVPGVLTDDEVKSVREHVDVYMKIRKACRITTGRPLPAPRNT